MVGKAAAGEDGPVSQPLTPQCLPPCHVVPCCLPPNPSPCASSAHCLCRLPTPIPCSSCLTFVPAPTPYPHACSHSLLPLLPTLYPYQACPISSAPVLSLAPHADTSQLSLPTCLPLHPLQHSPPRFCQGRQLILARQKQWWQLWIRAGGRGKREIGQGALTQCSDLKVLPSHPMLLGGKKPHLGFK